MGAARETALASSMIFLFQVENTNIHGVKLKMSCIIVIKNDLEGFVVTMHSGLCEQYVKSLGLTPSGFDFLFRTRPCAWWQQTPLELVLIPQANRCRWYRLTMPFEEMYCIGEGTVTHKLLPTCKAYNYNFTEGTCPQFSSPCPQAFSDPVMEFMVFRKTLVNWSYEWVSYSPGDPLDERMIATENPRCIMARLQVNNNDSTWC